MSTSPLVSAHRLLTEAVDEVRASAGPGASDDELLAVLMVCEGLTRRLDRLAVDTISTLERRGAFAERGYRNAVGALCDLLGWERFEARRRVVAAEQVCARIGLDAAVLPARLAATADVFAAGQASLRHVEVVARVLATAAAQRLSPEVWAGAEAQLAAKTTVYTPSELQSWGTALVEALDQDGAQPDDRDPLPVNELTLCRRPDGRGGTLKARFEDAALFDTIATVIDAKAAPLTADDTRSAPQRQAEALAEVCGYVLDHDEVAECGGFRPHLNVVIGLDDLENRARSALLDFGGTVSPESLRMLACDAAVIPIVMNGAGQPSTSAAPLAPSPTGCAARLPPAIAAALIPAVVARPRGATSTTSSPGKSTARPSCPTASWSAASTTGCSTATPDGPSASTTACPSSSHPGGSIRSRCPAEDPSHTCPPAPELRHRRAHPAVPRRGGGGVDARRLRLLKGRDVWRAVGPRRPDRLPAPAR